MSNPAVQEKPASTSTQSNPAPRGDRALWPAVDVVEDSTGITLYADLPGVSRERLNLRIEDDTLSIEGELAMPVPQGMQASHAEVEHARYRRRFTLSKELDGSKINADLSQGVLRVRIPKAEHAQPRRIEVNVA